MGGTCQVETWAHLSSWGNLYQDPIARCLPCSAVAECTLLHSLRCAQSQCYCESCDGSETLNRHLMRVLGWSQIWVFMNYTHTYTHGNTLPEQSIPMTLTTCMLILPRMLCGVSYQNIPGAVLKRPRSNWLSFSPITFLLRIVSFISINSSDAHHFQSSTWHFWRFISLPCPTHPIICPVLSLHLLHAVQIQHSAPFPQCPLSSRPQVSPSLFSFLSLLFSRTFSTMQPDWSFLNATLIMPLLSLKCSPPTHTVLWVMTQALTMVSRPPYSDHPNQPGFISPAPAAIWVSLPCAGQLSELSLLAWPVTANPSEPILKILSSKILPFPSTDWGRPSSYVSP